jgi:hypothetical protein
MQSKHLVALLLLTGLSVGGAAFVANAADAPKDNKGFSASKTTVVELGPEIEGMAGRQLRLRLLTIEPGGHIGLHSHKDRPAVVYFLTGKDTVTFADGTPSALQSRDESGSQCKWRVSVPASATTGTATVQVSVLKDKRETKLSGTVKISTDD